MKQASRAALRKRADVAFSKHVRERDGRCVPAEWFPEIRCNGNLQCCHLVSRRYHAIRWAEDNAVAGCAAHHMYGTHKPLEWNAAISAAGIDLWDLTQRALNDPPQDPAEVIERLKAQAA